MLLESSQLAQKRGQNRRAEKARREGPAGVQERGIGAGGFPRNLGEPARSVRSGTTKRGDDPSEEGRHAGSRSSSWYR